MRILFREPINQPLKLMEIENELSDIQELIGGYIEVIKIRDDICCILDEEGKLKGSATNFYSDEYGWIVGNVMFCGINNMEFDSLEDEQIEFINEYIGFPVVKD